MRCAAWKKQVVAADGGLTGMARSRKVTVLQGTGAFEDRPSRRGSERRAQGSSHSRNAIIAADRSRRSSPSFRRTRESSTRRRRLSCGYGRNACSLIDGGIIGLEMGTVYSTSGARLDWSRCSMA